MDTAVERAARRAKPYDLSDGKGLYLHVSPSGTKIWRYRFLWNGKAQTLTVGHYPSTSIAQARQAERTRATRLWRASTLAMSKGKPPTKVVVPAPTTFEALAREWHELQTSKWSLVHAAARPPFAPSMRRAKS